MKLALFVITLLMSLYSFSSEGTFSSGASINVFDTNGEVLPSKSARVVNVYETKGYLQETLAGLIANLKGESGEEFRVNIPTEVINFSGHSLLEVMRTLGDPRFNMNCPVVKYNRDSYTSICEKIDFSMTFPLFWN